MITRNTSRRSCTFKGWQLEDRQWRIWYLSRSLACDNLKMRRNRKILQEAKDRALLRKKAGRIVLAMYFLQDSARSLLDMTLYILPIGYTLAFLPSSHWRLFFFKFLEWWYTEPRLTSASAPIPPPPSPPPVSSASCSSLSLAGSCCRPFHSRWQGYLCYMSEKENKSGDGYIWMGFLLPLFSWCRRKRRMLSYHQIVNGSRSNS